MLLEHYIFIAYTQQILYQLLFYCVCATISTQTALGVCISFILCAGLPATMVYGGTSFVTTAPAPTTLPLPIVMPLRMIAPAPIQQSSSIRTPPHTNGYVFTDSRGVRMANKRQYHAGRNRYPIANVERSTIFCKVLCDS